MRTIGQEINDALDTITELLDAAHSAKHTFAGAVAGQAVAALRVNATLIGISEKTRLAHYGIHTGPQLETLHTDEC